MKTLFFAIALSLFPALAHAETAKEIVVAGYKAVFVDRNVAAIDRYFSKDYIQHNPQFPNGLEVLYGFAKTPPKGVTMQIGNVIADEEAGLVALHTRVTGFGPKPLVVVDIFRVRDGKITEHWDVIQEEVEKTVSGNPMWTPALR